MNRCECPGHNLRTLSTSGGTNNCSCTGLIGLSIGCEVIRSDQTSGDQQTPHGARSMASSSVLRLPPIEYWKPTEPLKRHTNLNSTTLTSSHPLYVWIAITRLEHTGHPWPFEALAAGQAQQDQPVCGALETMGSAGRAVDWHWEPQTIVCSPRGELHVKHGTLSHPRSPNLDPRTIFQVDLPPWSCRSHFSVDTWNNHYRTIGYYIQLSASSCCFFFYTWTSKVP